MREIKTHTSDNEIERWREAAHFWASHADKVRLMFGPVTDALIRTANISEGDGVLDVPGGTGEPALTIAEHVGPLGAVMCTDAVLEMLEAAEIESRRRRIGNVAFFQAPADKLPFDTNAFDAVTCRLGVMFFPDTLRALEEMYRVAKPGARTALAVWSGKDENPFFSLFEPLARAVATSEPEPPDKPGAFRYDMLGELASLLKNAGWRDVDEHHLSFRMCAQVQLEDFWTLKRDLSSSVREALTSLDEARALRLAEEITDASRPFFVSGTMDMPAKVLIVSGKKPGVERD
jgi:SAM-dependent methyltransferase